MKNTINNKKEYAEITKALSQKEKKLLLEQMGLDALIKLINESKTTAQ